eukprot:TRINITY_DN4848_c0_g1_i1.p1 TRINITY_DN4848_c0_g1~~TRINITY_DN4848_c0_g1_i1.p1  ORF type:complete len:288 (+),score=63.48 TRINITY_DN4848_c0_g1_i1:55-864(+)
MTTSSDIGPAGVSTMTGLFQAARSKREGAIKALDLEFQDFKETSLIEETYTRSDIQSLFSSYVNNLKVSLNKQFQDFSAGLADISVQILEQSDGKQVQLDIDDSRFTGASFEADMLALEQELTGKTKSGLLPSVSARGVDPRQKILTVTAEGSRLQKKAADIQQQFNAMMKEKTVVQTELNYELDILRSIKEVGSTPAEVVIQKLKTEVTGLEKDTDLAQAEAQGKIGESTQFQNLKTIIQRKNDEIKTLRARLEKFEVVANDDDGEDD